MRHVRGTTGWALLLSVAVLSMSACTGADADPAPAATPTTNVSSSEAVGAKPSRSPAPGLRSPTPPAAAAETDFEGAEAFVQYWTELVEYSYQTGDTETLRAVSAPSCRFCTSVLSAIDEAYSTGGSMRGGALSIEELITRPVEDGQPVLVSAILSQEALVTLDEQGKILQQSQTVNSFRSDIALEAHGSNWIVLGVDNEELG